MGKILIITGLVYLLYYTGNIVYDLFIKKPPIVKNESEGELISLGEIVEKETIDIRTIKEEDVEDLNTPGSYMLDDEEDLFSDNSDSGFQEKRFEQENEIDHYNTEEQESILEKKEQKSSFLSRVVSAINVSDKSIISKETEVIPMKISDETFRNFFEKATSHIVTSNENGRNFYKSSLVY